ncbi:hypothetical protein JXA84_00765 [candidate division WOR-3 bacterium]|nr:hypothetical protein [candidate division WOR-3 bacterium]
MKVFAMVLFTVVFGASLFAEMEDGDFYLPGYLLENHNPKVDFSAFDADSLYWQVLTNMTEGRCGVYTGYYRSENGETLHVHVFGGNPAPCTPHHIFDVVSNSWTAGTPMPIEMRYGASTTYENKVYMFGSFASGNMCMIYDIKGNSYSNGTSMPTGLNDVNIALVEDKGLIYLIGGGDSWTANNIVQVYDIAGDSYFYATPLPEGVMSGASGYLGNDTLVLATGYTSSSQWSSSVYKGYIDPANPANITWAASGTIPGVGRRRCGYASYGDKLFVIAGQDGSYGYLNSCYMYQSDSGWVQIPDKPSLSMNHTCVIMPITLVDASEMTLFSLAGYLNSTYMPYNEALHTDIILSVEEPEIPGLGEFYFSVISGNLSKDDVRIRLNLPHQTDVRFYVFDMIGRKIRSEVFSGVQPGAHTLTWEKTSEDGQVVPNGTYIFRIEAGENSVSGKITVAE